MQLIEEKKKSPLKWLLGIPMALLIAPLLIIGALFGTFFLLTGIENPVEEVGTTDFGGSMVYTISAVGEKEIPAQFIPIYKEAAAKYNVPWPLLAAEHKVETRFSSIKNMISPVGATGHLQFMPCTWVGWAHPSCKGLGLGNIPKSELTNPARISALGGYGVDGDGDGKADPDNLKDAIFSAANYLSQSGASSGTTAGIRKAVYTYNHAGWYVDRVMKYMNLYASGKAVVVDVGGVPTMPTGTGSGSAAIEKAIAAGMPLVGKSPYNFGGGRTQYDINRKSFDCSSFMRWIFEQGGVNLGPVSATTTDTLVKLGKPVKPSEMKRGDLVFFDTYKINGHVGVYLGNNQVLHDGSTYGVYVNDMNHFRKVFNGVVRRVVQ
ncbi:C40 family peptidase [Priestia megaterium]|uniref:C40 family peptidase n=1 Tax=Priestia megaterium TaxID=1404 RepID=UPI0037CBBC5E